MLPMFALTLLTLVIVFHIQGVYSFSAYLCRINGDPCTRTDRIHHLANQRDSQYENSLKYFASRDVARAIKIFGSGVLASTLMLSQPSFAETVITREDVGFIDLNSTEPVITDVCWMDIQIGDSDPQRIEFSLYGNVCPSTVDNFKRLCQNAPGYGYKGSDIFRIISTFSVQGGNIGTDSSQTAPSQSKMGKFGKAASGQPFPAENFRILHSYKDAGVISMMKDITNKGLQDSRFFITLAPDASWADEKYVAFGRVSKGMNLISGLTIIPVEAPANFPKTRVRIVNSGCY